MFLYEDGRIREVGQDTGPEMNVAHPQFLPNVILVHAVVDLQILLSVAGELRPGGRDGQVAFVGVSVEGNGQIGLKQALYRVK